MPDISQRLAVTPDLKAAILASGKRITEVAYEIGMNVSQLSMTISGLRSITADDPRLKLIADIIDVPVQEWTYPVTWRTVYDLGQSARSLYIERRHKEVYGAK